MSTFNVNTYLTQFFGLYSQFLLNFPVNLRPFISLGLAILIVYSIIQIIRKDYLFLILLVVLLPGSVPILTSIWQGIVTLIKYLLNIH